MTPLSPLILLVLAATALARPFNSTGDCHRHNGTHHHDHTHHKSTSTTVNLSMSTEATVTSSATSDSIQAIETATTSTSTAVETASTTEINVVETASATSETIADTSITSAEAVASATDYEDYASQLTSSSVTKSTSSVIATPLSKTTAASKTSATTTASASASPVTPGSDAATFVSLHNNFRKSYGAGAVTWNDTLASYAADHAKKCVFAHTGGPYGENLAAGVGGGYSITSGFTSWANEAAQYNWDQPGFTEGTGHFTQVVWKDTKQIGCAAIKCAGNTIFKSFSEESLNIFCEYYPPGNIVGDNNKYFIENVGTKQA